MSVGTVASAPTPPPVARPWIDSPFFAAELERRSGTAEQRRLATELHDQGFAILRGAADPELLDRIIAETAPIYDADPVAVEQRRVQDAWDRGCPAVRELAILPAVLDQLTFLSDRRPIPFQTLTFKWGTEQRAHADRLHFSCVPTGFMCGVWVALEGTDAGNGPLFYHPGSHRQPELGLEDIGQTVDDVRYDLYEDHQMALMETLGIKPVEFHAERGDALLWTSNIVHGGRPVLESGRTRWSQVTHYYFEDSIYYTPVSSDVVSGELFLKDVTDLTTLTTVPHRHRGRPVHTLPGAGGRSRNDRLTELGRRTEELEGRALATRDRELAELRASESFLLGNKLVTPFAKVRNRLRRPA